MTATLTREYVAAVYLECRSHYESILLLFNAQTAKVEAAEAELADAMAAPDGHSELEYLERAARIARAMDAACAANLSHYRAAEFCNAKARTLAQAKGMLDALQ
jgi:hypothetical protein